MTVQEPVRTPEPRERRAHQFFVAAAPPHMPPPQAASSRASRAAPPKVAQQQAPHKWQNHKRRHRRHFRKQHATAGSRSFLTLVLAISFGAYLVHARLQPGSQGLIRLKMVASMTSWSFAAAMPAFVRARRSSCRVRSVPAAAFPPRDSGARFHAPAAPVLTDLPRESGDAMPSNIYTARFFNQYPGPSLRFLKISATLLLQELNCYLETGVLHWSRSGMNELVFFLEEESAKAMLEQLFPLLIPPEIKVHPRFIVFEGG